MNHTTYKVIKCKACDGTGYDETLMYMSMPPQKVKCNTCKGKGFIKVIIQNDETEYINNA